MHFTTLINEWGIDRMAADLELPTKNVRRWVDLDSIPADWFAAIARSARKRGMPHVTEKFLAGIAEARRLAKAERVAPSQAAA